MKRPCIVFLAATAVAATLNGGVTTVKFGSDMEVEVDGTVQTFAANATFTPTAIPCVYRMRPAGMAEGERTFAIASGETVRDNDVLWRFPQYGEGNWVRVALNPYPASDTTVTLTGYKTSNFYYVDAENGNDDWDGKTDYANRDEPNKRGPKKSLQAANDAATGSYPIVFAAPGVYNTGLPRTTRPARQIPASVGWSQRRTTSASLPRKARKGHLSSVRPTRPARTASSAQGPSPAFTCRRRHLPLRSFCRALRSRAATRRPRSRESTSTEWDSAAVPTGRIASTASSPTTMRSQWVRQRTTA